jgi:hypothetical protein
MNEPVYLHYYIKYGGCTYAVIPVSEPGCRDCAILHRSTVCLHKLEHGCAYDCCSNIYHNLGEENIIFVEVSDNE